MVERNNGPIVLLETDIGNVDLELLSPAEHAFVGSGVSMNGASEYPLTPVAIFKQDMTNAAVLHSRNDQRWIRSNIADM